MGTDWVNFEVGRSEWIFGQACWPGTQWPPGPQSIFASGIGLGTAGFRAGADSEGGESQAVLRAALHAGIRVIDTATNYGDGFSEAAVGIEVRGAVRAGIADRDSIAVVSKAGYLPGKHPGSPGHSLDPSFLKQQIAASRRRMGLGTIDAYLLHNFEEQVLVGSGWTALSAAFAALEEEAAAGHIARYGVAAAEGFLFGDPGFHSLQRLLEHATRAGGVHHHFGVIELPVSLWRREAFSTTAYTVRSKPATTLDLARDLNLVVLGSIPLGHGKDGAQAVEFLRNLFPEPAIEPYKMIALQFARSIPGVHVVLPGITKLTHLSEALALTRIPRWDLASV